MERGIVNFSIGLDIMAQKKTQIAIISGDLLQRRGLEVILREQKTVYHVDAFDSFDAFQNSGSDQYTLLYIESELLALHIDYFKTRQIKVIPIVSNHTPVEFSEGNYLYTRWSAETMELAILDTFEYQEPFSDTTFEKGLSGRELEVLTEVARGMTNKEIADTLNISMNTVMTHRKNITAKLNIKTVSGLTFYALVNGLISGEEVVKKASD